MEFIFLNHMAMPLDAIPVGCQEQENLLTKKFDTKRVWGVHGDTQEDVPTSVRTGKIPRDAVSKVSCWFKSSPK